MIDRLVYEIIIRCRKTPTLRINEDLEPAINDNGVPEMRQLNDVLHSYFVSIELDHARCNKIAIALSGVTTSSITLVFLSLLKAVF